MTLTQEQLTELEAKHGDIIYVESPCEVVFRKPRRDECKMFRANTHNPRMAADAQEILLSTVVVYPTREEFMNVILEKYPLLCEAPAVSDAIMRLTGMAAQESAKR